MNGANIIIYFILFVFVGGPVFIFVYGCLVQLYLVCEHHPEETMMYLSAYIYPFIYAIYAYHKWKYLRYTLEWPSGKATGILILAGIGSTIVLFIIGGKIAAISRYLKERRDK